MVSSIQRAISLRFGWFCCSLNKTLALEIGCHYWFFAMLMSKTRRGKSGFTWPKMVLGSQPGPDPPQPGLSNSRLGSAAVHSEAAANTPVS